MTILTDKEKEELLLLARSAIVAQLDKKAEVQRPEKPSPAFTQKQGCFVTLNKNRALRGCIGTIEPVDSLMEGIERNAQNSAFRDPRFPPLSKEEIEDVNIEISVLTPPEILEYRDPEDLLDKLMPGVHGVILSNGWNQSTFLPQVWEQLPEPVMFLEHLCRKGGMKKDCWKDKETVVKVYQVEHFSEQGETT